MISKELLSLVLGIETPKRISIDECNVNIHNGTSKFISSSINLDTLGRLCKEWCINQDCYSVSTFVHTKGKAKVKWTEQRYADKFNQVHNLDFESPYFYGNTEPEAIILVTEWVAKAKGLL